MARKARRERGALGEEVLAALAAAAQPMTPAQVQAELGDDLAYTTVMTTLTRLYENGAVVRSKVGRGFAYALDGPPESRLAARRMRRVLDAEDDRAAVLARFVDELVPGDEQLLSAVLRRGRRATARKSSS